LGGGWGEKTYKRKGRNGILHKKLGMKKRKSRSNKCKKVETGRTREIKNKGEKKKIRSYGKI